MPNNENGPEPSQDVPPGAETEVSGTEATPAEIRSKFAVLKHGMGLPVEEDAESRPRINLEESLQVLSRELGLLTRSSNLFRQGHAFLTVDPRNGETRVMDAPRFCSWIEGHAWTYKWTKEDQRFARFGKDLAALVLSADEFRDQVRELRGVRVVRLPAWRGEGKERTIELLPTGYDDPTKIYTIDTLPYDQDWSAAEAGAWLGETLKDYPWADSRSMSAHVAAMLSPFVPLLLPHGSKRPMIVYNGNQPGTGKSTLARMALYPVYGEVVAKGVDQNSEELRKILDTAALERKPYLFLDDIGNLRSRELNSFLTSNKWSARVLGQSRTEEAPIDCQVLITGNQLDIGADLDRRAMVVDLFLATDSLKRRFEKEISDEWLMREEVRSKFLAFCWAAVRHWRDQGFERDPEAYRPSFEAYADVVGSIVAAGGYPAPFAERACKMGGDDEGEAIRTLLRAAAGQVPDDGVKEYRPDDLLAIAQQEEVLDLIVRSAKNPRQSLGHKLRKWQGRELVDDTGRLFQFGKHENNRGAIYPVRILPAAAEDAES